jgi:hypothetical protein
VERTLTAIPGIEEMQLVQNELHLLLVKLVVGTRFAYEAEKALHQELKSVFGEAVAIQIQYLSNLDQSRTGKYRFAICNV